jgi:hypothetical protein
VVYKSFTLKIEKEYKTWGTYNKLIKKINNHFQFIIGKTRHIAGKGFTFTNEARDLILFQPLNQ